MDREWEEEIERKRAHYQVNCFLAPKVLHPLPWMNPVKAGQEKEKEVGVDLVNGTVVNECHTGLRVSLVVCRCPELLQREKEREISASLLAILPQAS